MFNRVNGASTVSYFLFDSHCRNSRGITDGEIGFSILMKFESLFQIERYIEEAYQISGRMYPPYFQIQFIPVILSVAELVIIQSCQKSHFRQIKRQQRQTPKEKINNNKKRKIPEWQKGSQKHEETKNIDRIIKRVKKAFI